MSYREKRKQARQINEVKETARLIYMGVANIKQKGEKGNEKFFDRCRDASLFVADVMEEPCFKFTKQEIDEFEYFKFNNLENCVEFADRVTELAEKMRKESKIPSLYFPFIPTSVAQLSFTTLEVLLFFVIGISLYILL